MSIDQTELIMADATDVAWEDTFYSDLGEFPDVLSSQLADGGDFDFCQVGGDCDSSCGGS